VASGEALDMLHWAIHSVLHWLTAMAIKMASGGDALFPLSIFVLT
jgi:hypothetical protein